MEPFLTQLKNNILVYADEPSDCVKYTDGWFYQQIGREAANLYQQAVSQHFLLGLSSFVYTVTEGQTTFKLPGNFQKLITLQGVSESSVVVSQHFLATDYGENGVIITGPYEFALSSAPPAGSLLKLVYQKKAVSNLFFASTLETSTASTVDINVSNVTGHCRQTTNYYVGSYLHIVDSSESSLVDLTRRIVGTSINSGVMTITLDSELPDEVPADSVVEIYPEIPQEHWDAIAWSVVRKMRNSSRDSDAVTQTILEYKEARHWYLQSMAALYGRDGNQVPVSYPNTGEDEVWG